MFSSFEEELGVDGGGEGGDDDGGNVFNGERFGSFVCLAGQLAIFATE